MNKLIQDTEELIGLKITPHQVSLLEVYARELAEWNQRYSLTAITDPEKVRVKHFLDSFTPSLILSGKPGERVIDIGTGAGFPGIPLKILLPQLELTLVDSISKKIEFCEHVVKTLNLTGVEVIRARVEKLGKTPGFREEYDWAIARAVAHLSTLSEYLLPLIKVGGKMLAMKGSQGPQEAQQAQSAVQVLGGELMQVREIKLPGVAEDRYLVVIHKTAASPDKYPRRTGVPAKRPL